MLTLVNILIIFFLLLIIYQILLAMKWFNPTREGLKNQYKPYDMNDPNNALILAQQNAGNISYLKERMDDIQDMSQQVDDLSGNLQTLQSQVDELMQAQQDYANQLTGGSAPNITGAVDDEDDNEEQGGTQMNNETNSPTDNE